MASLPIISAVVATTMSMLATGALRKRLIAAAVIDHSNERRSHTGSVPRGGGLAFIAASLATMAASLLVERCSAGSALAVALVAIAVAAIGAIDDLRGLSAGARLVVHLLARATLAWNCIRDNPPVGPGLLQLTTSGLAVTVTTAWIINLTNLMDGIDGLAASSATLIIAAVGTFAWLHGDTGL